MARAGTNRCRHPRALAVRRDQQRQVRELRHRCSGRFENQYVLVGIRKMVLATDDVADTQVGIVAAGGKVIGRHAVGAQEGEVFNVDGSL